MDYIIFGIGSGATLVLIGWLLRDWGPRLRDRAPSGDEVLSASEMVVRMAWARFCATCGMAMVLCGIPILIVTAIAAALSAGDERGGLAVLIAFVVAVLLMLVWAGLYLRQFGSMGVYRPRPEKPKPVVAPTPAQAIASGASAPTVPAGADPSFDETASSRGGLGRFAAFLRKEDRAPEPEPPVVEFGPAPASEIAPQRVDTAGSPDAAPTEEDDDSATDAVIAELAGSTASDTEKRLSIDDPLVVAVDEDHLGEMSEAWGEIDRLSGDSLVPSQDEPATVESREGDESQADSIEPAADAREAAVDSLRRRRLARLTKTPPND